MNHLPFAVSDEALARIEKDVKNGGSSAGMCPTLDVLFDYQLMENGRITEAYVGEFFVIGFDNPECILGRQHVELTLGTRKVWMHAEDLAELTGKRLVLETVAVGVPNQSDRMVPLLRAVELPATPELPLPPPHAHPSADSSAPGT
jgi:hypothetical protein